MLPSIWNDEYILLSDAARELLMNYHTLYNTVRDNKYIGKRIGERWYVRRDYFDRLKKEREDLVGVRLSSIQIMIDNGSLIKLSDVPRLYDIDYRTIRDRIWWRSTNRITLNTRPVLIPREDVECIVEQIKQQQAHEEKMAAEFGLTLEELDQQIADGWWISSHEAKKLLGIKRRPVCQLGYRGLLPYVTRKYKNYYPLLQVQQRAAEAPRANIERDFEGTISVTELAEIFSVRYKTAWNWLKMGKFESELIHGRRRVRLENEDDRTTETVPSYEANV